MRIDDPVNVEFRRLVEKEHLPIRTAFLMSERLREDLVKPSLKAGPHFTGAVFHGGQIENGEARLNESSVRRSLGLPRDGCGNCPNKSSCPTRSELDKRWSELKGIEDGIRELDRKIFMLQCRNNPGLLEDTVRHQMGLPPRVKTERAAGYETHEENIETRLRLSLKLPRRTRQ